MTCTARCTVQDVGPGPAPVDVLLTANGDQITNTGDDHVSSVEVRLQLDTDDTHMSAGQTVEVTGAC